MPSRHDLPNSLPSPARRAPTQEFDYQELVADPKFHAVVNEHKKNGAFAGFEEGSREYNSKLKEIAVAFVGVANEKRATLFRNRGILNGRRGAFREAISCYNRALELSNNSPSKHVTLANRSAAYIKSEKFAEALEDAQEAALLCPEYSIAHSLMGYCHSRLGMGKKAVVDYNIALELNPGDASSQGLLAEAKKSLISAGETVETIAALEAPFVAKGKQEIAVIQAATTAAQEVPVVHGRYIDGADPAGSIQDMVAGMPIEAGCNSPGRDLPGHNSVDKHEQTKNAPQKEKRLSRKLSTGSVQAFASLTKIPGKLKHALGKKNRGSSSSKGHGPGQHLGSDFPGPYQNLVEDAAGALVPATCQRDGSVLAAPQMSGADAPRGASNPLFCADRHRHNTPINFVPAERNASSVVGIGVGGGVGAGGGGRAVGVFCTIDPSAGGPVVQTPSSGNGGGPAGPVRGVQQQRPQHREPPRQGMPLGTPPCPRRENNTTAEQRPGAHTAVERQREWSRRKSKDRQEKEGRPRSFDAAPEDSGGGATASLTPRSAPEDDSVKPSSCPPAPQLGPVQKKPSPQNQTNPQIHPQQNAQTVQTIVRRGIGPSWVPEKSGYASPESDFSEGSPLRTRAVAAEATASGGEDRMPSTSPNAMTGRDRILGTNAGTVTVDRTPPRVAKSSEKTSWTNPSPIPNGDVNVGVAKESSGDGERLDASASTEILMEDEKGVEAERALDRVLEGDTDCGLVYESATRRGGQNAAEEGENAQAPKTQTPTARMEPLEADAQAASTGKPFAQSTWGGAIAHDRLSAAREGSNSKRFAQSLGSGTNANEWRSAAREGSARGSPRAAVGDSASSMFADAAERERSAGLSVSVRAKIEMFERTARSVCVGGEEAKLKVTVERTPQPRRFSWSISDKVRVHEGAISAATSSNGQPSALGPGCLLSRSQSYQTPARASPTPTAMATNALVAGNGASPSQGS
eukprot:g18641.t1